MQDGTDISVPGLKDLLDLVGLGEEPDGADQHLGVTFLDLSCERDLVSRSDGDLREARPIRNEESGTGRTGRAF